MAESAPPPSPAFSGIDFNPSFFPSTTSDYVEFPTAQGTVTFGTIFATTIDTPTPSADFDFLDSEIGNINIGTSVPAGQTIKLGASTGTSIHCGSIDLQGTNINNAVAPATGTISIAPSQTTGPLYIGSSSSTGVRTTGGINIGTNSVGVTPITIGTVGQTTTALNGTSVNVGTKLTTPAVDATLDTTNMTIGSNLRGGNLTIGGSSGHTGTINIASGQTSGALNIGNGARTNTATINIGTQAALNAAMGINIGTASNSYTNLYGSNVLIDTKLEVPIINAKAFDTLMTIGSNLTSGSLTLGGTSQSGDINLATGQTSGDLFIGTGTRTAAGDINIGTGDNAACNLYIGHKGTTVSTQAVKINTSTAASGATTIGSSTSATTIGGTLGVTGTMGVTGLITASGGLTVPTGQTLTAAGNGILSGRLSYTSQVMNYTIPSASINQTFYMYCVTTAGTLTIPAASATTNQVLVIRSLISAACQIVSSSNIWPIGAAFITSPTTLTLAALDSITLHSDGGTWYQVAHSYNNSGGLTAVSDIKTTTGKLIGNTLDCVTDAGSGATSLSIGPSATSGNIVIGSALGTGDISIATAQTATGTVTIGSSSTATSIGGTLSCTGVGFLGGGISYIANDAASLSLTGTYNYMLFIKCGVTATQTVTLPAAPPTNQYITFRVIKGAGGTVTVQGNGKNIYANNQIASAASATLNNSQSFKIYYNGIEWTEY